MVLLVVFGVWDFVILLSIVNCQPLSTMFDVQRRCLVLGRAKNCKYLSNKRDITNAKGR